MSGSQEVLKYSELNKNKHTKYQNLKKAAKNKQEKSHNFKCLVTQEERLKCIN